MLVLSRRSGERISIGSEIEVEVLGIHKGRVRLGFSGPPRVRIYRQEVLCNVGPDREEQHNRPLLKPEDVALCPTDECPNTIQHQSSHGHGP
jgi:carbon storage regulator